ncbi:MAG: tRNA (uracil-5-)-methyltransferase [Oscillospiraceae bacterium]|nr:tRNA (uracil-5-)-methyltransferase [Oscillospiraceae bacterium]
MKDKPFVLVLASVLLSALLIVVGVLVGSGLAGDSTKLINGDSEKTLEGQSNDEASAIAGASKDGIAIPGFEMMSLKAGVLEQTVGFFNPEQNNCYFRIRFSLSDGTELYQSGMIKPGQHLETVELSRTLEAGTYKDATLRYECFALDSLAPLNGAETILNVEVLP